LYEEVGDFQIAGEVYLQAGMKRESAEAFLKAGYFSDAGALFAELGDLRRAGQAYESARDYDSALKIYRKLKDVEGYTRCLVKKGEKLEAGKMLLKMGKQVEAYRALQEITPEENGFREACLIMARMHSSAGRDDSAIQLIQRGIQGEPVNRDNLELYYELGRLFEKRRDFALATDIYAKILVEDIAYKNVANRARQLKDQLAFTAPSGGDPAKTVILPQGESAGGGRYKIIEELGRGGMGVVYKAHDSVLDRTVAYKVLPQDLKNHPKIVESLMREARALAKLHHPNIVTVFDAGQSSDTYFFVMEYIEGKNLREIVNERGALPINEALGIAIQTARALAYAHQNNIMHRDIKTSNVMITKGGTVKLMDFGLAKALGEAAAARTAVSGTPYYMSPEQTLGSEIDHRTDIYSFGVMLFELLTGQVPFKDGNIGYHHLHTPPPTPTSLRVDIPPAIERIVLKCLEKDKEKRYQTADELLKDLENCEM
jgi:tRNA A-37 threonylcarbamoyl transferase component Bud32